MKKIYEKCTYTYAILVLAAAASRNSLCMSYMPFDRDMYHSSLSVMRSGGEYCIQFFCELNATTGFKTSAALLGLWTIPLAANLARWRWKKYWVKRKVLGEPNGENIKAFHIEQASDNRRKEIFTVLSEHLPKEINHMICGDPFSRKYTKNNDTQSGLGYDAEGASQEEIDRNVARDMENIAYQPLMSQTVVGERGLNSLVRLRNQYIWLLYTKCQLYDVGLQVLWRGFSYGPAPITTWLMLGATETVGFFSWKMLSNKIFERQLWYKNECRDPYIDIGAHLFLSGCLYLNLMAIDACVINRLK